MGKAKKALQPCTAGSLFPQEMLQKEDCPELDRAFPARNILLNGWRGWGAPRALGWLGKSFSRAIRTIQFQGKCRMEEGWELGRASWDVFQLSRNESCSKRCQGAEGKIKSPKSPLFYPPCAHAWLKWWYYKWGMVHALLVELLWESRPAAQNSTMKSSFSFFFSLPTAFFSWWFSCLSIFIPAIL